MQVKYLGKLLGRATGWDGELGSCWWVYDFKPAFPETDQIPQCDCLAFNEAEGTIIAQDKEGNTLKAFTINWTLVPN